MCQSQEEGGRRCAAHTRPRYEALLAAMEDPTTKGFGKADKRKQARRTFAVDNENALNVAINHASTPSGAKQVTKDIARYKNDNDPHTVAFLVNALKRGEERAEAAKEITAAIRKAKEKVKRATTRSSGELKRSPKATPIHNMEAVYPGVAAMWDIEKNNGILPTEVTPNVNRDIWLTCKEGHSFSGRGNNVVAPIRNGRRFYPMCPECEGRKPRLFTTTQQELAPLVAALGNDPDAFHALTPALQYSLLERMGLLRGSQNSMSRSVGMSIVHGDLTLADVVRANDFAAVDARVRDNLDDEGDLATVTDFDTTTPTTHTDAAVDQVLNSTGVLHLVDPDSDLAADIARENNEALWRQAYANPDDLDGYVASLTARKGYSQAADDAIDRFTTELNHVRTTPLPDGYTADRLDKYGHPVTITPSLEQRRFAALAVDQRTVGNWSGTGFGKTLSAALAVQSAGAQETLVVCPKSVIDEWKTEFSNGFPGHTEIRVGLPTPGETIPPATPGVNRVWITNYEQFSGDTTALKARTGPLTGRLDAVVFDEIHKAKQTDEATASRRRRALEKFRDDAGEANPDLVVIGASATPVVNNLEEAKSVLRLVEGPTSVGFPTKPTVKNTAAAHRRLSAAGVRNIPTYDTLLDRADETVDITANVHAVQARINRMRKANRDNGKSDRVTPAMMERALLPEKIPTIITKIDATPNPSLIYTHYTEGMVEPMRTALEATGKRVGVYTGTETVADRAETLRKFRNGDYDVLIGSGPIGTGVDGLQHTSHNLIVASMPWTAAEDDQLIGRLHRRGQQHNVTATYILTEAQVGSTRWSWCKDNRQKRVHFKRDIANAAVDGILPDGTLDNRNDGAEKALHGLKAIAAELTANNAA